MVVGDTVDAKVLAAVSTGAEEEALLNWEIFIVECVPVAVVVGDGVDVSAIVDVATVVDGDAGLVLEVVDGESVLLAVTVIGDAEALVTDLTIVACVALFL